MCLAEEAHTKKGIRIPYQKDTVNTEEACCLYFSIPVNTSEVYIYKSY